MFAVENTVLLVVDMQERLAHRMHEKTRLFKNIEILLQAAQSLNIPILYTEHVPGKIGKTLPEITQFLVQQHPIEKSSFSCCGEFNFIQALTLLQKKQIILSGIEAHVCVYQTAVDLLRRGFEVQVVGDAVSSRSLENKQLALARLMARGDHVTSTEMILFELLKSAGHENFAEILKLIV